MEEYTVSVSAFEVAVTGLVFGLWFFMGQELMKSLKSKILNYHLKKLSKELDELIPKGIPDEVAEKCLELLRKEGFEVDYIPFSEAKAIDEKEYSALVQTKSDLKYENGRECDAFKHAQKLCLEAVKDYGGIPNMKYKLVGIEMLGQYHLALINEKTTSEGDK